MFFNITWRIFPEICKSLKVLKLLDSLKQSIVQFRVILYVIFIRKTNRTRDEMILPMIGPNLLVIQYGYELK